jgi:prepilin-type N-terminal cleavage/methylation domain-containing protein
MHRVTRHPAGFSLVELLIVISLMGILTALAMPSANSGIPDQLQSAADVIAADIAYARSLAVTNNSKYRLTFDPDQGTYVLQHSGTDVALANLPPSPFRSSQEAATSQTVKLADLPHLGTAVKLVGVYSAGSTPAIVTDLEFGPLGESTRSDETIIWLSAGRSAARRFLSIRVNPVTGLSWIEGYQATVPAAVASLSSSSL